MAKESINESLAMVSITRAKELIKRVILAEKHMPVFMHSSPGIGKSAVTRQIATELGMEFVDIRLSTMEPSDLCGIPYVSEGGMNFSIPSWFPTDPESKGILFFDELTNAPITTQHAAYRIILDRSLQTGLELPVGWKIVAAGNLKSDKTGAKDVAPALSNRFAMHIHVKADLEDFTAYAISNKLDVGIIGFLNFKAEALYRFDPMKNEVSFATPRSWEQASNIRALGFSDADMTVALSGCIGEGTTSEFQAFLKFYQKLPDFRKIMDGTMEYKVPTNDIGVQFAVSSSLIVHLATNYKDAEKVKNLEKVMTQLPDDQLFLIYKSLKSSDLQVLTMVVNHTKATFSRITEYFKMSK